MSYSTHTARLKHVDPETIESVLWFVVAVTLVGDIATTMYGLQLGLAESNPVAADAIAAYSALGMVALKALAVGVGLLCRSVLPLVYRSIVPLGLALPWTLATLANLVMIGAVI